MIAAQRRNEIREIILKEGSARAEEMARHFSVSEETIRRDFLQLQKEGYIEKNYGGAVAVTELQNMMKNISPVQKRMLVNLKEKKAIARQAAGLIRPGMNIFIDAGSTTWSITSFLKEFDKLTVITNSIETARDCAELENCVVVSLGGQVLKNSMSMVGPTVENQIRELNIDLAFMGTTGITLKGYCTSANPFEASVKRCVISTANRAVLLADSSKWSVDELYIFARFNQIESIITSDNCSADIRQQLAEMDVDIVYAPSD